MKRNRFSRCLIYSLFMAGTMTGCVSATVTAVNLGLGSDRYTTEWLRSWAIAFPVGFFLLMLLSPLFRRFTDWLLPICLKRNQ